jgi:hypothetical protein
VIVSFLSHEVSFHFFEAKSAILLETDALEPVIAVIVTEKAAGSVRVEQFLVVEAVVNRFQNSVYRQSTFFGDVIRGKWLQADRLPVNYLRANSPVNE